MANFVFNQGAILALETGIDWVGSVWECALYDETVSPTDVSVWDDISSGVVDAQVFQSRIITTYGAAGADAIVFDEVSPTLPDGRFGGIAIKRQSDNLLLVNIDEGFDGIAAGPATSINDLLGVRMDDNTYTFTLLPGLNNEQAWFRL